MYEASLVKVFFFFPEMWAALSEVFQVFFPNTTFVPINSCPTVSWLPQKHLKMIKEYLKHWGV